MINSIKPKFHLLDHLFLKDIAWGWVIIEVIRIRYSRRRIRFSDLRIICMNPILRWHLAELCWNVFIKNLNFLSLDVQWVSMLVRKIFVFNWDIVTRWRHKWLALHHRLWSSNFFITESTIINSPFLVTRWCFYFLSKDWFIIMLL